MYIDYKKSLVLNEIMKRRFKTVILFVATVCTLVAIYAFFVNSHNPLLDVEEQRINTTQVTPQRLFDHTWQVVKNEYYDPNFNDQYWLRWKNHYRGKIKTLDDAKVEAAQQCCFAAAGGADDGQSLSLFQREADVFQNLSASKGFFKVVDF